MYEAGFGLPQLVALLLLVQRGLEELYSQHNTRRLFQQGAYEVGRNYYPLIVAIHLGWIAGLAFLIPHDAAINAPLLIAFLLLQPLRYWIIATLGCYWTHRIITLPRGPIITNGPYRFLRHPNYAVTLAETLLLPLAFGQLALGIIFTVIWAAALGYKIRIEDEALDLRRGTGVMRR
jgi:methyltransferase